MNNLARTAALTAALISPGAAVCDVAAQGITSGEITGTVVRAYGQPLGDVQIQIRPADGGLELLAETRGDGVFRFPALAPGEYVLLAERIGLRPVLVTEIPVLPGRRVAIEVVLQEASGTVEAPDTLEFDGRALAAGSIPGRSHYYGDWALTALPQREADAGDVLRRSGLGSAPLQEEGLPSDLGAMAVGGVGFRPADHGALPLLVPTRGVDGVELLAGRPDVEWPGAAGAVLSSTIPGRGQGTGGEVGGVWGGEALAADAPSGFADWRAGGSVAASVLQDSAHLWVFGQAQGHDWPTAYWDDDAGSQAAFEEAGLDVSPLSGPGRGGLQRVNVGGSFDWRFAGGGRVNVISLYGQGERDHVRSGFSGRDVPASLEGRDLMVVADGGAGITDDVTIQVRTGYSRSDRDYAADRLVETALGDAAVVFTHGGHLGRDPAHPSSSHRSDFSGQAIAHIRTGEHHLKVGVGANHAAHERTHAYARGGLYLFSSPEDYAARQGVLTGSEGPQATARFSVTEIFGYGQGTWRLAPGLDVTTGLRYEMELLPAGDLSLNQEWLDRTGLDNRDAPGSASNVGVVAGFDWNVREQSRLRLRGDFAVQVGDVPPGLLGEAISHDGRITAFGAVGDVTAPADLGPRLTILSPGLGAPLTSRGSLGLSRVLGGETVIHLDGVLRQTVNLPTRVDLNLPAEAPFSDQYGRAVYGRLSAAGGLVHAEPGGNRRFSGFDAVSAIGSTASSTYWGVTAALEKRFGALRALGSYTFSRTRDDWLGGGVAGALYALPPARAGEAMGDDWAESVSDFDTPHRLTLAAEITPPFSPAVTLGGFWRMESGRPFTPGFGRAIDANADGVAGNDPAFIDESIDGILDLQDSWDCLRGGAGTFAERNSCRHGTRTLLDAWVGLRMPGGIGPVAPELRVEALALAGDGHDTFDTALYILDPEGIVELDDSSGEVRVPLAVNPRFGTPLAPAREFTRVRISLRMAF